MDALLRTVEGLSSEVKALREEMKAKRVERPRTWTRSPAGNGSDSIDANGKPWWLVG